MKHIRKILAVLLALILLIAAAPVSADGVNGPFLRIFHLDAGRKYFSPDEIRAVIDLLAENRYTHLELALGNDALRFVLDDMSVSANGTVYAGETVKTGIVNGNNAYYRDPNGNCLTESEMDGIIAYAREKNVGLIPLINAPGHMDAIIDCMEYVGIQNPAYNRSARTVDVTNTAAVGFTTALIARYVGYFAAKGVQIFNMGCDEYANDRYSSGSMGFGNLISSGKYGSFISFVNGMAAQIKEAGMTPMAFNDGIYFNNNKTSGTFDTDILIAYWTAGWTNYNVRSAANLVSDGFTVINTNDGWYYVLGRATGGYSLQSAKSAVSGTAVTSVGGSPSVTPAGSMMCVWCDTPSAAYTASEADNLRYLIETQAAGNPAYFTAVTDSMWGEEKTVLKTQTVTAPDINTVYGATGVKITASANGDGALSYAVKSGSAVTVDAYGNLTIKKAGAAVVTVTAAGTETYASGARDVTVTVAKAVPAYTVPSGLTAKEGDTLSAVALPSGFSWEAAPSTSVGAAGARTFKVKYTPADTDNYETVTGITVTVSVTAKNKQTVTAADVSTVYGATGVKITASTDGDGELSYTRKSGNAVTVDAYGNLTVVRAGTAVITVTAAETGTYARGTRDVTVTVAKAAPSYTAPSGLTATEGSTLSKIALPSGFSWEDPGTTPVGAAGSRTFTVRYTPADTVNYDIASGIEVTVTVTPRKTQTVTASDIDTVYNTAGVKITASTDGNGALSYAVKSGSAVTVDAYGNLTIKKAGSAVITVTAAETDTYAKGTKDVNVTVAKATPSYTVPTNLTATEGSTLSKITLPDGFSWEASGTTSVGSAGIKTFNAKYTPADTDNYTSVTGISVTVLVTAKSAQTVTAADIDTVYGATGAKITASTDGGGELSYAVKSGEAVTVDGYGNLTIVKAGASVITVTAAETDTYAGGTKDVNVTVAKAVPAYTVPSDLTAAEGDTLASITLPAGFAWKDADTSVGTAGIRTFLAVYTPDDTVNYMPVSGIGISVTVTPLQVLPAPNLINYTKESGAAFAAVTFENDNRTAVVSCARACIVAVRTGDDTYTRLTPVKRSDNVYAFDLSGYEGEFDLIIALKGDANRDGYLNTTDLGQARSVASKKHSFSGLQMCIMDFKADGIYNSTDLGQLRAMFSGNLILPW